MNPTLLACRDLLILASRPPTVTQMLTPTRVAYIAGGLTALLLAWLGYSLLEKYRRWEQERLKTTEGLFDQLCHAHELSRAEKKVLAELNAPLPVEQWPLVFIDPQILLAQVRAGNQVGEHAELGEKLFGQRFAE